METIHDEDIGRFNGLEGDLKDTKRILETFQPLQNEMARDLKRLIELSQSSPNTMPLGGDPSAAAGTKLHTTALHDAARAGKITEARRALDVLKIAIDARDEDGRTALYLCVAQGRATTVEFLCQRQANCNIEDLQGFTPLHVATTNGDAKIVRCLLQYGATDTFRDDRGRLAVDYAIDRQDHFIIWVLKHGSNLETLSTHGTALHTFTRNGQMEAVRLAIQEGSDVSVRDHDDNTAFINATIKGHIEMVKVLYFASRSVLDVQNKAGFSAPMIAAANSHIPIEILETLLSKIRA